MNPRLRWVRKCERDRLEKRRAELARRVEWRDDSEDRLARMLRDANPDAVPGKLRCQSSRGGSPSDAWWVRTVERGRSDGRYEVWVKRWRDGRYFWRKFRVLPDQFIDYDSELKFF